MAKRLLHGGESLNYVLPIMLLPDDPGPLGVDIFLAWAKESSSEMSHKTKEVYDQAKHLVLQRYLDGKPSFLGLENQYAGWAVGNILLCLWLIDKDGSRDPSLAKARFLVSRQIRFDKHKGPNVLKIGADDSSIKSYWRKFASVSHLWAAKQVMVNNAINACNESPVADSIASNMSMFFEVAKFFQDYADNFESSRTGKPVPLFPTNAWRVADSVEAAILRPPALEAWMRDALKQYRHR